MYNTHQIYHVFWLEASKLPHSETQQGNDARDIMHLYVRILGYLTTLVPFRKSHSVEAVLGTVRDSNLARKLTTRIEVFRGFTSDPAETAHHGNSNLVKTAPYTCT